MTAKSSSCRGFGTHLIKTVAGHKLDDETELTFAPQVWSRSRSCASRTGPQGNIVPSDPTKAPLPGRLVLVVEDEALLAVELELLLQRHGWRVLGPAGTVAEALQLLNDGEMPDVAVLDVNLRGEVVTPVAERLQALGVPFVLASAYDRAQLKAAILVGAMAVSKPVSEQLLLAALERAVSK